MNTLIKNPAAQGSAGRARSLICSATNGSENIHYPLQIQLAILARRIGALDPAVLATLAALAFGGGRP